MPFPLGRDVAGRVADGTIYVDSSSRHSVATLMCPGAMDKRDSLLLFFGEYRTIIASLYRKPSQALVFAGCGLFFIVY